MMFWKKNKGKSPEKRGIRWTLFCYLALFCGVVLLVIWLLQAVFLDRIYSGLLYGKLNTAAGEVASAVAGDDPGSGVEMLSVRYDSGIAVFRVESGALSSRLLYAGGAPGSVLQRLKNEELRSLYEAARKAGGTATRTYSNRYVFTTYEGGVRAPGLSVESRRLVYVRLFSAGGADYAAYLDAAVVPVGVASSMLRVEILILSVVLIVAAVVLAYVMSRRIAAPIAHVTEGAKALAAGHYDAVPETVDGYREIGELASTLHYAAGELSQVDRLQKELIANISHDLRTPLTMIIGYGEVMRDIEGENKPENVQVIIDEAKRLSDLVSDLMQLSRYNAGCEKLNPERFDLGKTVAATVTRYRQMLAGKGYTFVGTCEENLFVNADRARILQVIYNLINNAVNYSIDQREIAVSCRRAENGQVLFEVIDHGEGIPPDKLKDIWQRYYKVDRLHNRSVVGSGLGLSIVRGILELHRAHYGVESRVGEGSRFFFTLPLAAVEESAEN